MAKRSAMMTATAGLLLGAAGLSAAWADDATPAPSPERLAEAPEHWELLTGTCVECHNFEDWAGGVAFDILSPENIPAEAEIWEEAVRKLRGGLMPPPGEPRADAEATASFISWMEATLDEAAAVHADPGRVVLHRLNRTEYENAVRDLLALEVDAKLLLPTDDKAEGFDNIASVLQVSPSFLDQYITAADIISGQAIGEPAPRPEGATYFVAEATAQHFHVEGLPLGTRGGAVFTHNFPADGDYTVSLNDMATGGYVIGMEFAQTVVVFVDGEEVYRTMIGGEEDLRAIDQEQAPAISSINARLKDIPVHVTAGPHEVAAAFVARTFAESDADLHTFNPGGGQDRVLAITSLDIRGPFNPTGLSETPSRRKVFSCYPEDASEEDACAEEILTRLARQAFRRATTDEDLAGLMGIYRSEKERAGFEAGVRGGLTAILASPHFLYRGERAPEGVAPGEVYPISDLELASRLAFFLWSSVPDDELLEVAARGELQDQETLEAQVARMLADPRAESLVTNFAFQWLRVNNLDGIDPDPALFPYFDEGLRDAFREEMRLWVHDVFAGDHSVLELLNSDTTYVNERLALHYDINDVRGDRFRKITLEDENRWGLFGKGSFLLVTSYPNRTTPVLRGAYVLENITGTPPAAPPPGVEAFDETDDGEEPRTVRERLIKHREDPACNSCHGVMDPLGIALENFDAVGRWRDKDRHAAEAIDASGELPDGTQMTSPADLREALTARPDQFVQAMTEKMMIFALGRTVEYHDMPAVRAIVRQAAEDDYRFSSLVMGVINSPQFRMRRAPDESGEIEEAALHR